MVMRVLGIQLDYLECAYRTRYYVINKINGDINAIHDVSLEITEFKGCFSPFDLENLEAKVCRLALSNKDEEDAVESQYGPQMFLQSKNAKYGGIRRYGFQRK